MPRTTQKTDPKGSCWERRARGITGKPLPWERQKQLLRESRSFMQNTECVRESVSASPGRGDWDQAPEPFSSQVSSSRSPVGGPRTSRAGTGQRRQHVPGSLGVGSWGRGSRIADVFGSR